MSVTVYGVSPTREGDAGLRSSWMRRIVEVALDEDLGPRPGRDVTTLATVSSQAQATAHLVAREDGVVAGLPLVPVVVDQVARRLETSGVSVEFAVSDGTTVTPGTVLATLQGPTRVLLIAERTLLNLASRASGVATATAAWSRVLTGTGTTVLDTRKTTPGLRELDKYAVRCGGGTNKRMGLYDVAMVKDNHVVAAGSITAAVSAIRRAFSDVDIQVEADTREQAVEAVAAGAKFLLLDNMSNELMTEVVAAVRAGEDSTGRIELEATGNLTVDRAASVAATGVDYMSVGALTHSAAILDLALDLVE